jgi:RNA-directed DNA polymerase
MTGRRQKKQPYQMELAFTEAGRGEAPMMLSEGNEPVVAQQKNESPTETERMMEQICEPSNVIEAWKRVKENKGSPGIDDMKVEELKGYLEKHWARIREELLTGRYRPQPVKRVEIPKPDGGTRKLGIPTVLDRLVQQAVMQVLQEQWDNTFSEHSYGFRPRRSQHQAIAQAQEYIKEGYQIVVDVDLEKFFDRVNHDVLMNRVARRVKDKRVLKLIGAFLRSGVLADGLVSPTEEGTPQGGPLSPLLSNLLLDELDKELERNGHRFVRYADDCNIYVRSQRAGERVMAGVRKFLTKKLKLKVNEQKSAVDKASKRKFLSFSFTGAGKRRIAPKALERFKDRIRELTARGRNKSAEQIIKDVTRYLRGWRGYFGFCETPSVLRLLDGWIRHRLRTLIWRRWKTPANRYRQLRRMGIGSKTAAQIAYSSKGPFRIALSPAMSLAYPNAYFRKIGLVPLSPVDV